MKVLQITAAYKPAFVYGGPTMSVARLCEALAMQGTEVKVLTTTANGKEELNVIANSPVIVDGVTTTYFNRLTKDHTHFSPKLLSGLRKEIAAHRQQHTYSGDHEKLVIHIHAWWNLVSILSCAVAKWYKVPVVLSPRGMLTDYTLGNRNTGFKAMIHSILGKSLLKYCHIHTTSEKEKQDVLKHITPKSISVIYNLVNFPLSKPSFNPSSTEVLKLVYLSRIEEKKGLELLFSALANLNINWILTIAGSGEENYVNNLKQVVGELKLADRIKWIGQVDNSVKFPLLAENDLMVLTSYNENFANVVIESLSVGTPVLISDQVGLSNYVTDKDLGWICELTVDSITAKLMRAYEDKPKRDKIKQNAPEMIRLAFGSDALIEKYINLYTQII